MTDEEAAIETTAPPRRRRHVVRALLVLLALLLVAVLVAWTQRRPIADNFVRRELARRGVPATYRVAEIGFGRQRLTDVVIGDPRSPDLIADRLDILTGIGFGSVSVTGVEAGRVRLRATLRPDGTVSFGSIDRLLPPPSGKPFALPQLNVAVDDGRVRLATPYGVVGAKLSGKGGLADGFVGNLALVSERLAFGDGCAVQRLAAAVAIEIADARPTLTGPVNAAQATCGGIALAGLRSDVDADLNERFDRWRGQAQLAVRRAAGQGVRIAAVDGIIGFDGGARRTQGMVRIGSGAFASSQLTAAGLSIDGRYSAGQQGLAFDGTAGASGAALPSALLRRIADAGTAADGTPVGPIVRAMTAGAAGAARRFDVSARLATSGSGEREVRVDQLDFAAANGARATLGGGADGDGVTWRASDGVRLGGTLTMGGGGLPDAAIQLRQAAPGAPVTGTAIVRPYAAGDARLALTPVEFSTADGGTRIATQATLSGPLGDGRVEALSLPIDARWDGGGRLAVNRGCAPLSFARLSISGLVLDRTSVPLCPEGAALVTLANGRIGGGARIGATQLSGRLGGTPLALATTGGRFALGSNGFSLGGIRTRLGMPDRVSVLDIARLDGRIAGGGVTGAFTGAEGQIANVPLLIREAAGDWGLAGGVLDLNGALGLRDADAAPRFEPLASEDFRLRLAGNRIDAAGTLFLPAKRVKVADVTIAHDLGRGVGGADLIVPGIAFSDGFQPNELTRLTFGVIADVRGSIDGRGRIDWSPDGVTSTGVFRTAGTDLAAAFGPVTGISGEIRFTDLLGLVTAPGQVATIAEVNPGIAVTDGVVRYRLLEGLRVGIEGGRWPLGGGQMVLEPTVLDFAEDRERRMTFRVTGVDAGLFLQQFAFENLNASGTFDGVLPMIFDQTGGRIEGGRLEARPGGGNIAYVGEVTKEDVGFWGNLAFQALKSIDYQNLTIEMDGPLAGEMVTAIRFGGVSQGEGTSSNFLIRRLAKLPFVFNVRIKAPFRQLIDSVQSYYDPSLLIERNLEALQAEQRRQEQGLPAAPLARPSPEPAGPAPPPALPRIVPAIPTGVQPPESENVP